MLPNIGFNKTASFLKLKAHFEENAPLSMKDLFENNSNRFQDFHILNDDLLFDYSKNILDKKSFDLLINIAKECQLGKAIKSMFNGERINENENRAVLHTALRNSKKDVIFDGKNITSDINIALEKIKHFSDEIRNEKWLGYTGKPIKNIVNIGIGGSDLGPAMVVEALQHYSKKGLDIHFVSNVDGTHIAETLKKVNPETTLFLIASKTFTTQETMTNATSARSWFLENGGKITHVEKHFVAMSTNIEGATQFGINPKNIFTFWDWVGGRYSLWSSIGLSIACSIGFTNFKALLEGASEMDDHFQNEDFENNIPVIMALLGLWYSEFFDAKTQAILPYDQYLHKFSAFLQQLDMESNGKSIDRNGNHIDYPTGPVVWGQSGTNGQHAFYQLIHQGTHVIPCDFIGYANSLNEIGDHHDILMSHFFAQTEALMIGKDLPKVVAELMNSNMDNTAIEKLTPHKIFKGNNPTNTLLFKILTPKSLGKLIAIYEHKVFVQGILWNVFSFDQWGVELGKVLAKGIHNDLSHDKQVSNHDSSTNQLINRFKKWKA